MPRTGRPRKPAQVKALQGTLQPHREPANPVVSDSRVRMPTGMTQAAKNEWRRVVPELRKLGIIGALDVAVLAMYCESYSRWKAAETVVQREGHFPDGKAHPAIRVSRDALDRTRILARELGMSPSARNGISAAKPKDRNDESWLFGDNTGNTGSKRLRVIAGGKDTAR